MRIIDRNSIRSGCLAALTMGVFVTAAASAQTPPPANEPPAAAPPAAAPPAAPEPQPSAAPETAPADPPPAAEAPPAPPPPPPPAPVLTIPAPAAPPPAPGVHAEKAPYEAPTSDVTSLTASGGGALNGGNTNSYQVNLGADFQLIRQPHGFSAAATFAYGVADVPTDETEDLEPIVRNLFAKARYDFFLSAADALFLATAFRWDPFAGIDRRNQGQIGYLRYFLRQEDHRFWGELGYDLTADDYGPVEGKPDAELPDPEEEIIHSVRVFFGYDNKLNEAVTYLGGLEALLNVEDPEDTRLNFSNALRSSIAGNFALEVKLTLAFDNVPATPDAEKLDTTALVNLIYQLI